MKKILLYGFLILLVFNLMNRLWTSITLDEEEEVSKFIQKVEMLESSDDNYDVVNYSNKYLNFLEENIDWFSSEQSKEISEKLNSLRSSSKKKIDSIDQEKERKKQEEERKKQEEEIKKQEEEERLKKSEEREKETRRKEKYNSACKREVHKNTIIQTQFYLNNGRKIFDAIYEIEMDKISDCKYISAVTYTDLLGNYKQSGFRTSVVDPKNSKIKIQLYYPESKTWGSPVYIDPVIN